MSFENVYPRKKNFWLRPWWGRTHTPWRAWRAWSPVEQTINTAHLLIFDRSVTTRAGVSFQLGRQHRGLDIVSIVSVRTLFSSRTRQPRRGRTAVGWPPCRRGDCRTSDVALNGAECLADMQDDDDHGRRCYDAKTSGYDQCRRLVHVQHFTTWTCNKKRSCP